MRRAFLVGTAVLLVLASAAYLALQLWLRSDGLMPGEHATGAVAALRDPVAAAEHLRVVNANAA